MLGRGEAAVPRCADHAVPADNPRADADARKKDRRFISSSLYGTVFTHEIEPIAKAISASIIALNAFCREIFFLLPLQE